ERIKVIENWSRISNDWIVIKGKKSHTYNFKLWLYSAMELKKLLLEAGFGKIEIFGNWDGGPYDPAAVRLIVAAYK
ncbi:MAG: SAM-dependent methyltransferase, partial [bacterium]|nr:SAM-dependent methyltransferase [bacterium]